MFSEQLFSNYILFFTGLLGILYNRNSILIVLMGIELSLLGLNLNFILLSITFDDIIGQLFAFFILTIAAAEAAIGLAIIIAYFKVHNNIIISNTSAIFRS